MAPAACGKSTLSAKFVENGYVRVNQDTLGSFDACKKSATKYLSKGISVPSQLRSLLTRSWSPLGLSVCVDNTNLDVAVRAKWLELARSLAESQKRTIRTRCVYLRTSKAISFALGAYRLLSPETAVEDRRKIDKMVTHTHFKKMVVPSNGEGFDEVQEVDWVPEVPADLVAKRLFSMYLQ